MCAFMYSFLRYDSTKPLMTFNANYAYYEFHSGNFHKPYADKANTLKFLSEPSNVHLFLICEFSDTADHYFI